MSRINILKHQYKAIKSKKQEVFLAGGVGAGKTLVGSVWILGKVQNTPKDVYGLIVSNTYNQLYDTTIRAVYEQVHNIGIIIKPPDIPRGRGPADIFIWNGSAWIRILLRSLDHYERLSGLEVGWYWADEVWQTKREAIDILNARLRDYRMPLRQALFTTTLDDQSTWMYERFVENYDEELQECIYAKTEDNKYLPDGYVDTLKRTYSEMTFKRMVLAEWVTLDTEKIYTSFSRDENIKDIELDRSLPLMWSHDFNIGHGKPMSSCILQYHRSSQSFAVIDEIILERSDTNDAVHEFQQKFPEHPTGVVIYGDASGNARDTRSRMTDYEILRRAGYSNQKVPRSNPSIRERHNIVNALLKNANKEIKVYIHSRCKTLIKGLETVHLRRGASYLEDDSQREQHVTTALGYCLCVENPNRPSQVHQFRAGGI